jgi:hypothetical protein
MLMICDDGAELSSPSRIDVQPEFVAWLRDVGNRGARRAGTLLRPPAEAVTVRVRDGQRLTSDGPFAETKAWIAGCEVVECENLDEAIAIAAAHPAAGRFPIEIRPFWEVEG